MYLNIAVQLTLLILWITSSKSEITLDEKSTNVLKDTSAKLSSHDDEKLRGTEIDISQTASEYLPEKSFGPTASKVDTTKLSSDTESSVLPLMTTEHLPDKPLQLVMPDDEEHRSLVLIEENVKHLHYINGPVAVVAVVGKFHSGKSFLLNQLMGKKSGFGIGPTVQPHTMGIWMWGKPTAMNLTDGRIVSVIFLDTEVSCSKWSDRHNIKCLLQGLLLQTFQRRMMQRFFQLLPC
jgi:hypothetical protein